MRTLGNIIWHIPFLGFLFSLAYALGGLFFCITIIGIPIGLGWLQFSLYLLSPFSKAMVSREDLDLLTGESQSGGMQAFSTIVRILYFPFGLFATIGALCTIIGEFISIIGIPCGIVWAKSLSTIFNPVNKVCVPRAVAMEIERRKEAGTLEKYTSQAPNINSAEKQMPMTNEYFKKAQAKSDDELNDILRQKDDYNPKLVHAAEKVLQARVAGTEIVEQYQPTTLTYINTLDFTKLRGEVLIMIGMLLPAVLIFIFYSLLNIYCEFFSIYFDSFDIGQKISIFACIVGVILVSKGFLKIKKESEYKNIIGIVLILISASLNLISAIRMFIQYNYHDLYTPISIEYLLCGLYSFSSLIGVILWKYLNKNTKLDYMGMLLICSATIIDFFYFLFYRDIYTYITESESGNSTSMLYLNYIKTILYISLSIYGWYKFIGLDTRKNIINL